MPRSSKKRPVRKTQTVAALGRAELAAEFLKRNRSFRTEHTHMEQRIARGTVARETAEAAFARHWGLSFRVCAG
ncbi:MAG: DUF6499 domain-containing protein [Mesorhizobium sp.]|nr:DUF6499 domain-containing protein [Mesorhizobium sp.]